MGEDGRSSANTWNEAAGRLADLPPTQRLTSPHFVELYRLALKEAPGILSVLSIDRDRAQDFASELVVAKLDALVDRVVPYPFFRKCLKNKAKDWLKSRASDVQPEPDSDRAPARDPIGHAEATSKLNAVWRLLTPRSRQIFAMMNAGDDRETIAREFRTTRANVDQLISRARKELKEHGFE